MGEKESYLFVPQEMVRDQGCSNLDVVVWCYALFEVYSYYKEDDLLYASQIAYQIKRNNNFTPNYVSEISECLRNLLEAGYLKGERINRSQYLITRESFDLTRYSYFIKVKVADVRRIMQECSKPNTVLRYYLIMLSTIDYKTNCGTWRNESIADVLGNDASIVSRILPVLEKMGLLYVYRSMQISNTYGRMEDKDSIIKVGKERGGDRSRITKSSNYKRRMTQLYNQIAAGREYDAAVVKDVRKYCEEKNDQEKMRQLADPSYEPKLYDISVLTLRGA